jgi:hypothetical protein
MKKVSGLAYHATRSGVRIEDLIKAAKEAGLKGKISEIDLLKVIQGVKEEIAQAADEDIEHQQDYVVLRVHIPELNTDFFTLVGSKSKISLREGETAEIFTLDDLVELAPHIPRSRESESRSRPEPESEGRKETRIKKPITVEVRRKAKYQALIDPELYRFLAEHKYELSYMLYDSEGEVPEHLIKSKKRMIELLGEQAFRTFEASNIDVAVMPPISLMSKAARRKAMRRDNEATRYLIDTPASFIRSFPSELKFKTDAPRVYRWLSEHRPSQDAHDIPFYVAAVRELKNPGAPLDDISSYWLQVANSVEYVLRDPWTNEELVGKKLSAQEASIKLAKRALNEPHKLSTHGLEMVLTGLWAAGLLSDEDSSLNAVTIVESYFGPVNYVVKREKLLRKVLGTVYQRVRNQLVGLDFGKDFAKIRSVVCDGLENEEKASFLAIRPRDGVPIVTEGYRNRIIDVYLRTHPEEFKTKS